MVISLERNERKSAAKRRYKIQDPIGWLKTNSLNILRGFDKHTHTHHTHHTNLVSLPRPEDQGEKSQGKFSLQAKLVQPCRLLGGRGRSMRSNAKTEVSKVFLVQIIHYLHGKIHAYHCIYTLQP